jgi:hypothetical protein
MIVFYQLLSAGTNERQCPNRVPTVETRAAGLLRSVSACCRLIVPGESDRRNAMEGLLALPPQLPTPCPLASRDGGWHNGSLRGNHLLRREKLDRLESLKKWADWPALVLLVLLGLSTWGLQSWRERETGPWGAAAQITERAMLVLDIAGASLFIIIKLATWTGALSNPSDSATSRGDCIKVRQEQRFWVRSPLSGC